MYTVFLPCFTRLTSSTFSSNYHLPANNTLHYYTIELNNQHLTGHVCVGNVYIHQKLINNIQDVNPLSLSNRENEIYSDVHIHIIQPSIYHSWY